MAGGKSSRRLRANLTRSAAPPADPLALLTSPDKVLWPRDGITKRELVAYYAAVAPVLLPHLHDRPLVLRPYPAGIDGPSYYRQSLPRTAPPWLPRFRHIAKADAAPNDMALAQDLAALLWVANQSAIEIHPWLSRTDQPDQPDYVVFDLDILDASYFPLALEAALLLRAEAERRGMSCYAKTSGGDGIHVYVPIRRGPSYEATRPWALAVARTLREGHPALIATESRIQGRERLVLVDYAQNALGKTTVAAYSVRPRPAAPVSMPLAWDEVEAGRIRPADFTIRTAPARIAERGDLFAPVLEGRAVLPAA